MASITSVSIIYLRSLLSLSLSRQAIEQTSVDHKGHLVDPDD